MPKTVENFRRVCTGEMGTHKQSQKQMCFAGSKVHRVVPKFMIQAGDWTKGNGMGSVCIYGDTVRAPLRVCAHLTDHV